MLYVFISQSQAFHKNGETYDNYEVCLHHQKENQDDPFVIFESSDRIKANAKGQEFANLLRISGNLQVDFQPW